MYLKLHLLRAGGLLALLLPVLAHAHEPPQENFDLLAEQADAIVQSRVTKIEYGLSQPGGPAEPALPFTYVTVEVQEALKGRSADGASLTLRFLGGPFGDGRYLLLQGAPLFDVGDEGLLFVKGNGTHACPLVSCGGGRFRSIEGRVYDEDGFELRINPAGKIVYGSKRRLAAVEENLVGNARLRRVDRVEVDAIEQAQAMPVAGPAAGEQVSARRFNDIVKDRVRQRISPEKLSALPAVASVRAQEKFVFAGLRTGGPAREAAAPAGRIAPRTEAERAELEAIDRNQGNPVLPTAARSQ